MKILLPICLLFVVLAGCSKHKNDDTAGSTTTLKLTIEDTLYTFQGKRISESSAGCAIQPDGTTGFRLVAYDGLQYVNFWIHTPVNNITTTTYTYTASSMDWNLQRYNKPGNLLQGGSCTLTFKTISNGKYSGTFAGMVSLVQTSSTKTVPVSGEFNDLEIVQ